MNPEIFDCAIIGAGAAGLMAAIFSSMNKLKTIVFESGNKPGKKLLATGGGRCNFTHSGEIEQIIQSYGRNKNFLKPALYEFPPDKVISFFEDLGVESVVEKDGCVFPKSNKSSDILNALLNKIKYFEISIKTGSKVSSIKKTGNVFEIKTDRGITTVSTVVIATGGLSYPETGSTGVGYSFATSFGHTIITPLPSLVSLVLDEKKTKGLAGVSIPYVKIKTTFSGRDVIVYGDIIFTHRGLSGPAIFDLSSEITEHLSLNKQGLLIDIDFLPQLEEIKLDDHLLHEIKKHPHKNFISLFDKLLPNSLIESIFQRSGFNSSIPLKQLDKKSRIKLIKLIKKFPFFIIKTESIDSAIVTKGGVNIKEINKNTMESKLVKGLFFAGEVIDIDGKCGGYNLQMCWSTGRLAGLSAAKSRI